MYIKYHVSSKVNYIIEIYGMKTWANKIMISTLNFKVDCKNIQMHWHLGEEMDLTYTEVWYFNVKLYPFDMIISWWTANL